MMNSNYTSTNETEFNLRNENPTAPLYLFVVSILICTMTICFNTVSILVVGSMFDKRRTSYFHIISLALTDMMVGITIVPIIDSYWNSNRYYDFYDCAARFFLFGTSYIASIIHIFGICLERVLILYEKLPKDRKCCINIFIILLAWIVGIISMVIMFYLWAPEKVLTECSIDALFVNNLEDVNLFFSSLSSIFQLAVLMCMLILFLFVQNYKRHAVRSGIRKASAKDFKICLTIIAIAVMFLLFDAPITIVLMVEGTRKGHRFSRTVRNASLLFAGLNSTCNPVVYVYRIPEFRKQIIHMANICKQNFRGDAENINQIELTEMPSIQKTNTSATIVGTKFIQCKERIHIEHNSSSIMNTFQTAYNFED